MGGRACTGKERRCVAGNNNWAPVCEDHEGPHLLEILRGLRPGFLGEKVASLAGNSNWGVYGCEPERLLRYDYDYDYDEEFLRYVTVRSAGEP